MSIYQATDEVEVRERRLQSVLDYEGTATDLLRQSRTGKVQCPGKFYSQCSDCAEGCAETITCHILDTVVISHAPIGCSVNSINHFTLGKAVSEARGLPRSHKVRLISSNLEENDTVYGGAEKLRTAVHEAERRYHPKAIFIQGSCASGIIGEDLESMAAEFEQELGYPIIPVYCEGFKSKIWSSGFDAAFHGLLRRLITAPQQKQMDLVNIFNFEGSDQFTPFLKKIGLRVNYLIPLASLEQIGRLTEAVCTAHICETLATYVGAALEEQYKVPEVKAAPPFGIDWTDRWLREIAGYTDRKKEVDEFIFTEHGRIMPELAELRKKLAGKRLYVLAGDSFAHNLANIAKDLDVEIIGFNTLHHDLHTDSRDQADTLDSLIKSNGDVRCVTVCNKQPYQLTKVIQQVNPDILIVRHMNLTTLGTKLGIPTLFEGDANYSIGYDGVLRLGRRFVEAFATHRLVDTIAAHSRLPYTSWWLNKPDSRLKGDDLDAESAE